MQTRYFTILAVAAFAWALLFAVAGFAGAQEETTVTDDPTEEQGSEAQAQNQEQQPAEEQAKDVSEQAADPNLSITKDGPERVQPGKQFVYTLVVKNSGGEATTVTVTDRLPKGVDFVESNHPKNCPDPGPAVQGRITVTCEFATLGHNASRTIELTVKAPDQAKVIENKATVESAEKPNPKNSNTVKTTVAPKLEINKLDDPDPVDTGDLLLYTLRVTNQGSTRARKVVITDDLPLDKVDLVNIRSTDFDCHENGGLVRCTGTLSKGETGTVGIVVEPEETGDVKNTAKVAVGNLTIDEDTETTHVEGAANNQKNDQGNDNKNNNQNNNGNDGQEGSTKAANNTSTQEDNNGVDVVVIKPAKQHVIKATIPAKVLPNTGGMPLAALALIGLGLLVVGVSVFRFGIRRRL